MMAYKIILIAVVMAAGTNAFGAHFGQWVPALPIMQPPPGFLQLPTPPPLFMFGNHHHFPNYGPDLNFASMPPMNTVEDIKNTVEDIKNTKPRPGYTYQGASISTAHAVNRDKDGNLVNTGQTFVMTNDNGNTKVTYFDHNKPKTKK